MYQLNDEPKFASALIVRLVEEAARSKGNDEVLKTFSTTELFVLLYSLGDSPSRVEDHALVRDYLLTDAKQHPHLSGLSTCDSLEYARLVDSFLEDLVSYSVSEELKKKFTDALRCELKNELKRIFNRRMAEAQKAGVSTSRLFPAGNTTGVVDQTRDSTTQVTKNSSLLAGLLVVVFSAWLNMASAADRSEASAASEPTKKPAVQGSHGRNTASDDEIKNDLKPVIASLDAEDPRVRTRALELLAMSGTKAREALPKLRRQIREQDPMKRWEAAWGIAYISSGAKDDVQALTTALSDKNDRVSRIAALALGRIGPAAKPALSILEDVAKEPYGTLASSCIRDKNSKACNEIELLLQRESPALRLQLEERLNRGPGGGACMCSLA